MSNEINVSVIVPVYNVEEYLEECLDSLLFQGDVNMEIIMLDDGSTDSSGEIADRYSNDYENFHCYHIENGGLGHARNRILEAPAVGVALDHDLDERLVHHVQSRWQSP